MLQPSSFAPKYRRPHLIPLFVLCLLILATSPLNATGWHTSGTQIDNPSGAAYIVSGVNWYGAETTAYAPSGLWAQDYTFILNEIKANGFNTIRLPYSNQTGRAIPSRRTISSASAHPAKTSTPAIFSPTSSTTPVRSACTLLLTITVPKPATPPKPTASGTSPATPAIPNQTGPPTGFT